MPGLGHWYAGYGKKSLALFCVSAGVFSAFYFSNSIVVALLASVIYLSTMLPATLEAWQLARGVRYTLTQSKLYVIFMLIATGFTALPLLWQSERFSRPSKIFWSVTVVGLAVLFFTALALWGPRLEEFLDEGRRRLYHTV